MFTLCLTLKKELIDGTAGIHHKSRQKQQKPKNLHLELHESFNHLRKNSFSWTQVILILSFLVWEGVCTGKTAKELFGNEHLLPRSLVELH